MGSPWRNCAIGEPRQARIEGRLTASRPDIHEDEGSAGGGEQLPQAGAELDIVERNPRPCRGLLGVQAHSVSMPGDGLIPATALHADPDVGAVAGYDRPSRSGACGSTAGAHRRPGDTGWLSLLVVLRPVSRKLQRRDRTLALGGSPCRGQAAWVRLAGSAGHGAGLGTLIRALGTRCWRDC
jgi:hypothetical protein